MKQIYKISTRKYEYYSYQIDKVIEGRECSIIVRNLDRSPYGVCAVIKYNDVGKTINSPLVNWDNLVFCSNHYGVSPNAEYMNNAVQRGTKTTATAYVALCEYQKLVKELPANCHAVPYNSTEEHMTMAYVYRDGTLNSLFGFENVKQIYTLHGIESVDWNRVEKLFKAPLSYFSDSEKCGLDIQCISNGIEMLIVGGLLLGYPIESTVAYIKNNIITFSELGTPKCIQEHFKTSNEPIFDSYKRRWVKNGNIIFQDGKQESLYY